MVESVEVVEVEADHQWQFVPGSVAGESIHNVVKRRQCEQCVTSEVCGAVHSGQDLTIFCGTQMRSGELSVWREEEDLQDLTRVTMMKDAVKALRYVAYSCLYDCSNEGKVLLLYH